MNHIDLQNLDNAYKQIYAPQKVEEGIRDTDPEKGTAERKARLEKKRGMKVDDHPEYKKEEGEITDNARKEELEATGLFSEKEIESILEADSLAAMAARREKRMQAQRKKMGTSATGQDFGHDYGLPAAERKKRQKAEFDAFVGRGKKKED